MEALINSACVRCHATKLMGKKALINSSFPMSCDRNREEASASCYINEIEAELLGFRQFVRKKKKF